MTIRKRNLPGNVRHGMFVALTILTFAFLTTAANASCFDRGRGASPASPSGLIVKLGASTGAASGTIVGLWHATYTTSDNQPFQESFDVWHSDGTELESANINPAWGNVCVGVWKQVGSEIHLHHVGWAFDGAGNLVGPFTVDDVLTLGNRGSSYSGSFDFKQYDTEGHFQQEVTGTISATRIGVN